MNYKIREALQDKKVPYVLVMGDREIEQGKVAVRARARGPIGECTPEHFLELLEKEIKEKTQNILEL